MLLALSAGLAGCQTPLSPQAKAGATVELEKQPEWLGVASDEDAEKIGRLSAAWSEALADARRAGFSRDLKAEGALLESGAALPRAAPPPGSYNCRLIKLGSSSKRERAYQAFKPFFCFVGLSGEQLTLAKQTGSRRPAGYLWETEDSKRLIFLGSVALGNEDTPLAYGDNPARDMAGVFERHGNFRYRLVVPWPRQESKLDVFELIPVPEQP